MTCKQCGGNLKKNSKYYCSFNCQKLWDYNEFISLWKKGEINGTTGKLNPKPSKHIYRYFFETEHVCCKICGIKDWLGEKLILELDHIDGDRLNSEFENLRVLCPNCHSQTQTFRNKKRVLISRTDNFS